MSHSDLRLARRARRGDRSSLAALYERYRSRLYGYLLRSTGDHGSAEDLYQEVWIKVMNSIERYQPSRGPFRAWLFRIAANAAVDAARYRALRQGPELDAPGGEEGGRVIDRIPSREAGPERLGAAREALRKLDAALGALPATQREAVLLRHQQGLSYQEMAVALSVPEGTAKSLVHRGVRALRRAKGERDDE